MSINSGNGIPMASQIFHFLTNFGVKSIGAHLDDIRSVIGINKDVNIPEGQTYKVGGVPLTYGQYLGSASTKAIAYNAQAIDEDITIPDAVNAYSAGPITINTGRTVTINSGSVWTVF